MLKKLSLVFGSKTKAQEIILLLNDVKKVVRQGFYEHEIPKIEKFCRENALYLEKSKFKVLLADGNENIYSYSNKGMRIDQKDKRSGMYFTYLSKDEEKALLAAYYELMKNDYNLGLLLGYPECCVRYFCQKFDENNTNLELKPSNVYTNITQRHQDHVLISHFPCDSDCRMSVAMGRKYLEVISEFDKERARELVEKLRL